MKKIFPLLKTGLLIVSITIFSSMFTGQLRSSSNDKGLFLKFGVYQTDKATEMYRKFAPLVKALEKGLSNLLDKPVNIEFKIFGTYQSGIDAIVSGEVDFVRFGPASYIKAKNIKKNTRLLAMELKKGKMRFKGHIVVNSKSNIKALSDLKGKTFAFGNPNSTIGRFLAQAELVKEGIYSKDLKHYKYFDRHDVVAKAVELGDFSAGSIKNGTFKKFERKGTLRTIHSFENITKPWIASEIMPEQVYQALKQALFQLKNSQALKALKSTGFSPASDSDYDFVREMMTLSTKFDMESKK